MLLANDQYEACSTLLCEAPSQENTAADELGIGASVDGEVTVKSRHDSGYEDTAVISERSVEWTMRRIAADVIQECLKADTLNAFNAATSICERYGLRESLPEVRSDCSICIRNVE